MLKVSKELYQTISQRVQELVDENATPAKNVFFFGCAGRSDGSYRCGSGK